MPKILMIENSEPSRATIKKALGHHEIVSTETVQGSSQSVLREAPDLILLDLDMSKKDCFTFLEEMQSQTETRDIPVMCLMESGNTADKVTAFSLGAVDCIQAPVDPIELRARVDAKIQRTLRKKTAAENFVVGNLEIDRARHRVWQKTDSGPVEVHLTQTEFKLLCCLSKQPDQVFTRDHLLVCVWGEDAKVLDRVVDVHICSLRKKIGPSPRIQSVSGVGYRLTSQKKAGRAAI